MQLLVLNGPNLNKLGQRNPEQYGQETLDDIQDFITSRFSEHTFEFIQSNKEGPLIDKIQTASKTFDGLVANFGGFSHTSVAIHDALELCEVPVIEVHLSNIYSREEFRQQTITGRAAEGIITGFGKYSYILAVHAIMEMS